MVFGMNPLGRGPTRAKATAMKRYLSIDILRAVAILLMVQMHFVENLSSWEASSAWLHGFSSHIGNWAAPLFTTLSGLSFALWVRKQEAVGRSDKAIMKIAVRRGMFIFVTGFALAFCIWLPEALFMWDVLTLIGTSLVILSVTRKLPPPVLVAMCVAVLVISPPLRGFGDYPAYWEDGFFDYDFTLREVIYGFVVNGYFPLLPWIIFPLVGFVIGETAFSGRESKADCCRSLLLGGAGLMLLSGINIAFGWATPTLFAKHYCTGVTLFPASTAYVVGMLGLSVFCLGLLHRWVDQNERITGTGSVSLFFRRFSSFSLTIYVVHLVAHLWPLWIYAVAIGKEDPTFYWRAAMSAPQALALSLVFVVVCYVALIFLGRYRKLSFEWWMRWVCD